MWHKNDIVLEMPMTFPRRCSSITQSCLGLCNPMDCSTLGFPVLHYLPGFAQTHAHWVNDAIPCHHLLLLPSIFPIIRVFSFSSELALPMRWLKYWSFSFSISFSNEYSGLTFFRIDWFVLLAVQGTVMSLLQHHSSKASLPQCSSFFMVQLSDPYMTTEKTIALTRQTFVRKVMSLLFNTLSRFVTAFLPRSKHLLILWLQSSSSVILAPKKIKSVIVSIVSPSICHEVVGLDSKIFVFECWVLSQLFHSLRSLSSRGSLAL